MGSAGMGLSCCPCTGAGGGTQPPELLAEGGHLSRSASGMLTLQEQAAFPLQEPPSPPLQHPRPHSREFPAAGAALSPSGAMPEPSSSWGQELPHLFIWSLGMGKF